MIDWGTLGVIGESIAYGISVISITGFAWLVADLIFDKFRNGWTKKKEAAAA